MSDIRKGIADIGTSRMIADQRLCAITSSQMIVDCVGRDDT
jgi:hypothetical protein